MTDEHLPEEDLDLLAEARRNAARSVAPPGEQAGAVVVCEDGRHFAGAAMVLRVPGLSVCAEQVALSAARAATEAPVAAIALWIPEAAPEHPCGKCLQVWKELAPQARFVFQRGDRPPRLLDLEALLPDAFEHFEPRR